MFSLTENMGLISKTGIDVKTWEQEFEKFKFHKSSPFLFHVNMFQLVESFNLLSRLLKILVLY